VLDLSYTFSRLLHPFGLWREKRGGGPPEDLSGNLVVQLGTMEELNRSGYERNTGSRIVVVQR
jgi:hypothetical protein